MFSSLLVQQMPPGGAEIAVFPMVLKGLGYFCCSGPPAMFFLHSLVFPIHKCVHAHTHRCAREQAQELMDVRRKGKETFRRAHEVLLLSSIHNSFVEQRMLFSSWLSVIKVELGAKDR